MKNKIYPCVIGLGYVGLPVFVRLNKKFKTVGYDINSSRVSSLKKKNDINKEFESFYLKRNNQSIITKNEKEIKNCNFYIVTVPTPLKGNNIPDISFLTKASETISKYLKKNDVIIYESTVYPGTTKFLIKKILEKKSKLIENKDFFVGYSPERVNPGDKKHSVDKIDKILAIKTNKSLIKKRILSVYLKISKRIHLSNSLEEAETAKIIENIQRDLNIALMNDILIFSKKMKLNYANIIKLASTKWNFLKFQPGLVGGHCLPVDPYYLHYIAKVNKINLRTVLAGRIVNSKITKNFVLNEIIKNVKKIRKNKKKIKILIIGITYKKDVPDIRNSLSLEIFRKLQKTYKKTFAYDYICNKDQINSKNILNKIKFNLKFDIAVFLVNHKRNINIYKKLKKTNTKILDLFNFYR